MKISFTWLIIIVFFSLGKMNGQNQNWSKVELTPTLNAAAGKMEFVADNEVVYLSSGLLFHVFYDENYTFTTYSFENQVTGVTDFGLIDFDRDGDKDVVATIEGGILQTYERQGDKYYYIPNTKILPYINGNTFTIHDFDEDGFEDLIVNNTVYLSTANGQFTKVHTSIQDDYYPRFLGFLDIDEDGDKDMMIQLVTNLFLYKNVGNSGLSKINALINKASWTRIIKAGNKDIIIVFDGGNKKFYRMIFNNDVFSTKELGTYPHTTQDFKLTQTDLNGDGVEEIISNQYINQLTIIEYDPQLDTLRFTAYPSINYLDFSAMGEENNKLFIRYGDKMEGVIWDVLQGKYVREFISPLVFVPVSFFDIDGDGNTDLVQDRTLRRYLGDRNFESLKEMNIDSSGGAWKDFDDDGDLDYVLTHGWYQNTGNLEFLPYTSRTPDPVFTDPQILFTNIVFREDLDGDGDIDVLTYNRFGEPFELYENNGGTFSLRQVLMTNTTVSGYLKALYFEDFDGDGIKDILIAAAAGMAWVKNEGQLSFSEPKLLYDGVYSPNMVVVGDINNDGIQDVLLSTGDIVTGALYGSTWLYLGALDSQLPSFQITSGKGYHRARFANLDQIGWKEIVFSNEQGLFSVRIPQWQEADIKQIPFQAKSDYNFLIRDLNDDGMDDIICANNLGRLFYLINGIFTTSTCPLSNVYLRTQEQVNQFVDDYGSCQVINGDLFLGLAKNSVSDIKDISGLINIHKVEGDFTIHYNTNLIDFTGMDHLDTVLGSFKLNRFGASNLKGFETLKYIGNDLELQQYYYGNTNRYLDTKELANVNHVGGDIYLASSNFTNLGIKSQEEYFGDIKFTSTNPLTNVDFLKNTKIIRGNLLLENCAVTTLEPAKNVEKLGGLTIRSTVLSELKMGTHIDSIPGSLLIVGNEETELFSDTSFLALKYIGSNFQCQAKSVRGFSNLERVKGDVSLSASQVANGFLCNIKEIGDSYFMTKVNELYPGFLTQIDSIPGGINLLRNNITNLNFLKNVKKTESFDININPQLGTLADIHPELELSGRLLIARCPKLNFCGEPFICNHIASNKLSYFIDNGLYCNNALDIACIQNAFTGGVFYDQNQDGIMNSGEFPIQGQRVVAYNHPEVIMTSAAGGYKFHYLEGDSIYIQLKDTTHFTVTTTPDHFEGNFEPGSINNANNHFGLYHKEQVVDFQITGNLSLFVCNRPFTFDLNILNLGSNQEHVKTSIRIPPPIRLDSIAAKKFEYDEGAGIVWVYSDSLMPFEKNEAKLWLTAPALQPNGINSYDFAWESQMQKTNNEWVILDGQNQIHELRCAYDPNDKQVIGPYKNSNLQFGKSDYLYYTIRFQNTGDYFAENVLLVDTLSSYLDADSLILIAASHSPMEMKVKDNVLSFYFPTIMLPDSSLDFTGSQGYVQFKIKTKSGIDANEFIENKAHIYFDFNDAIVTNTVQSFVLLPDAANNISQANGIRIYPQPAQDRLFIKISNEEQVDVVGVMSSSGCWLPVFWIEGENALDVTNLPSGYYILSFISKGKIWNQSFIKR